MTDIEQQIEQIAELADRHYPGPLEVPMRLAFRVQKLEERLREYAAMRLAVRQMRDE
jgi:hypothetical protein